ncbi:GNAT family N-acetyltransferase [bacterium]|nr:GNAT family N-acetyltransferase [bacterium]
MSEFLIRTAELRDRDVIVDMNARLAWESEEITLIKSRLTAGVQRVLEEQAEAEYLLAEYAGDVVGQMMLTREWSDWRNGWFFWIQSVYVVPEYRRQGVFRGLLQAATETVGHRADAIGMRLYVEDHNDQALETYRRLGFEDRGYRVMEYRLTDGLTE